MEKVVETDFRRTLAHVFPGFLLYLGLLLAIDTFLTDEDVGRTWVTSFLFEPTFADAEAILSVIGIGIFVGYILGILIDGVGHSFLDDRIDRDVGKRHLADKTKKFNWINRSLKLPKELNPCDASSPDTEYKYHTLEEAERATFEKWIKIKGINTHCCDGETSPEYLKGFPKSHYYLYPFTYEGDEDKVNLSKNLIDQFFSFYEFYRNSGISILIISVIFPFYLMKIQDLSFVGAIFVTFFMLLASALLFYSALGVYFKYKTARLYSIEALLRKSYGTGESKPPATKVTTGFVTEVESNGDTSKSKFTSSLHTETTDSNEG
jgi:hypothetical protein